MRLRMLSTIQIKSATAPTDKKTTPVNTIVCRRVGQATLRNSDQT